MTHAYLRPDGTWSKDLAEARNFESANLAIMFCSRELQGPYQVVLKVERAGDDIILMKVLPQGQDWRDQAEQVQ